MSLPQRSGIVRSLAKSCQNHLPRAVLVFGCALLWPALLRADQKLLIRAVDDRGKETSLYEKVVVVSARATLSRTPEEQGDPIEPFAIFFRLKADNGDKVVNNKVRVGTSEGVPLGWIPEKDVKSWNTRFILDPIEPQADRAFSVDLGPGLEPAKQNATPEGKRRYALIHKSPREDKGDDTAYPVIVYAGNVQALGQGGTIAKERNELRDVKLEIVFVIETTDFMLDKYDGKELLESLKELIREQVKEIQNTKELKGAVRLGIVEYQDNTAKAKYASNLVCDLTEDPDLFLRKLNTVSATMTGDDFPDDVLAGLNTAVTRPTWTSNSVKHIILVGKASCQLNPKGKNVSQFTKGPGNQLTKIVDELFPRGYNSSGLSIPQLIGRARPQGGTDSRARTAKTFHAMRLSKQPAAPPPGKATEFADFIKVSEKLVMNNEAELKTEVQALLAKYNNDKDTVVDLLAKAFAYQLIKQQADLALSQYKDISRNGGEADGVFIEVEPNSESIRKASVEIAGKLRDSFKALVSVREKGELPAPTKNPISQPLYTLVGAAAEKFKDQPTLVGTAQVRDLRGREVAHKKVLVSQKELKHLRSTLDALHTKFKGRVAKADRQDVSAILNDLKQILAETSAGQAITADVKLKEVVSDLPLRTAALNTSAADLALMTSDAFTQWLARLETAIKRIDDLLDSRADWLTLSDKAVNEKFTFLRLNELP